ncbi:MAG: preprotein translocase subunit SecA [Burkholderiaceae bacterium]|nr:preprotein translocase subunit SecA [Burkholderiaceae bacterium]
MIDNLLKKIFGSRNDRLVKTYGQRVAAINALEPAIQALSDEGLRAKTAEFRQRVSQGESLDSLLNEAFAVCREAGRRALGMRHFDVQLIGGMVLNDGKIAEMRTGEGKTLVATLPAYLNALAGKGVHVVTVNDYLAERDATWMGKLYQFLGLSVGVNLTRLEHAEKQAAYAADITYGTNNEYGFDYLRDNMVLDRANRVQRPLSFAIVDEVDSILIDEARTPLIISGHADDQTDLYHVLNGLPAKLTPQAAEDGPGDYWVDEKSRQVFMSEAGFEKAEQVLAQMGMLAEGSSLYDPAHISLLHHLNSALRAHTLFFKDQHYVVQGGKVIIVDEFTGRLMPGRRWSEGLHQAIEAKEGVAIEAENQTLASITFQNYFRMYEKLSGMTGTADTEAYEFQSIYNLETVVIPTHRPMVRLDLHDQVFKSVEEKYEAILKDIKDRHGRGQPILVGTTSIENSELLSSMLAKEKLDHQVLNAKQHEREAEIVAQAGRPGMITIATNMAGRGTDIVLGGNVEKQIDTLKANDQIPGAEMDQRAEQLRSEWQTLHDQVIAAGGLHIVGTERHESRRIDNQLRGRAGRQGDPGSSRFYLSMDDPLLRIFAGDRMKAIMNRLGVPHGEPIEAGMVSRSIESAQRKVENRNFDMRKQLLEYDDVANEQRKIIYRQRNEILEGEDLSELVTSLRHGMMAEIVGAHVPRESVEEQWDLAGLEQVLRADWRLEIELQSWAKGSDQIDDSDILERVVQAADLAYQNKVTPVGREAFNQFERSILLQAMDTTWREHLAALDHLRQGIHLRGYAQKNPKQEYKREAFALFEQTLDRIRADVTRVLMNVEVQSADQVAQVAPEAPRLADVQYQHAAFDPQSALSGDDPEALALAAQAPGAADDQSSSVGEEAIAQVRRAEPKVGRNDPCPCGSGKKYKLCHGRLA